MTDAGKSRFVYVTYIRTTPERLWSALTSREFAEQYWRGAYPEADWKVGGSWKLLFPDGRLADAGPLSEVGRPTIASRYTVPGISAVATGGSSPSSGRIG